MKLLLQIILIGYSSYCFSSNRDRIWLSGFVYPDHINGMDFTNANPDTFSANSPLVFFITNAGICDTSGQLLFYSNGDFIANRNYSRLLNSTNFNPTLSGDSVFGSNGCQSVLILPQPGSDSLYCAIHVNAESFIAYGQSEFQPLELRYSIIDKSLDNGLGGIIASKKGVQLIDDTLTWGRITACRHGNGRDWWVLVHRYYSDKYYNILLTPDSMQVSQQLIGSNITYDALGQSVFSLSGDKYAMSSPDYRVDLFDFDRCTGSLSNSRLIRLYDILGTDTLTTLGCAFSASGRFLYVTTNLHIFQYDTWASNINSTGTIVATWDSSYINLATTFFLLYLGPDRKIYCTTYNGTYVLHVINNPDSLGMSCNVVQHGLFLSYPNSFALPNMPNYDLGRLIGSPCDTITGTKEVIIDRSQLYLYPNPATNYLVLDLSDKIDIGIKSTISIYDAMSRLVGTYNLLGRFTQYELRIANLPSGMYQLELSNGQKRLCKRFIKQ